MTICSYHKENIFGYIETNKTTDTPVGQGFYPCCYPCHLSPIGKIIREEIENLEHRFVEIKIEKYVIMPNHVHLLVRIERQEQSPCPTLGDAIGAMKSISTKRANQMDGVSGRKIWQFRFHEHIIRNQATCEKIWQYIDENPLKWELDCYYQ